MMRQRIFHIWVLLLGLACIPSGILAQTLPEITEPDNTYLRHYKDRRFDEHRPSQPLVGDSIFTVLGRWAWGYCLAVDTKDNFAFIGNGPTFQALDMTNPSSPTIVGEYIVTDRINDIVIRGNLAYVAMAQGLVVMDIADPTHPQQLGELYLSGIPQQLVVDGSIAYVLSWGTGITNIVDISNPSQPVTRSAIVAGEFAYCIGVRAGYVYLGVTSAPVMRIVNATNPDSISYRDTSVAFFGRTATTVDTLLLIGASPTSGPRRALKIFSVADPAYPRFIGEVVIPGGSSNTGGIRVVGTKAYLAALDTGVVEVDIANPAAPQIRRVLNRKPFSATAGLTGISGIGLAATDSNLLVAYYTGLLTVSKVQSDSLREVSFFASGGTALDVVMKDSIAYVASELSGLWVLDVSDASRPRALSNIQNGGYAARVAVADSVVYVLNTTYRASDTTRGLWAISVSNLSLPNVLSHHVGIVRVTPAVQTNAIARLGNLLFISQNGGSYNDSTLEIVDVSNPSSPNQVSVVRGAYSPFDVAVKDSIVYLATPDSGIIILDARIPTSPQRVGRDQHTTVGLALKDTLLFAMSDLDSVYVLSLSNAYSLRYLGATSLSTSNSFGERLSASGGYVYLTRRNLSLLDVRNPAVPIERGVSPLFIGAASVAVVDDKVFATDVFLGLWILRNDLITDIKESQSDNIPNHLKLHQNFPNPFNPSTSIGFYLPRGERIQLELYNLLGQKIRTLIDDDVQNGSHRVLLNVPAFSSGVYFYRLTSSLGSLTRRMLLIK